MTTEDADMPVQWALVRVCKVSTRLQGRGAPGSDKPLLTCSKVKLQPQVDFGLECCLRRRPAALCARQLDDPAVHGTACLKASAVRVALPDHQRLRQVTSGRGNEAACAVASLWLAVRLSASSDGMPHSRWPLVWHWNATCA